VRRGFWIAFLAVVAFGAIVIARLPASWVVPAPPSTVACAAVDGSIWNGSCTGLTAQGLALGDLTWNVYPLRLLTGKLCANITLTRPTGSARGELEVGLDKSITARKVEAAFPLDQDVRSLLPQNMRTLRGTANADIAFAHVVNNIVQQVQGRIEIHDLEDHDRGEVTRLGSYSLTFPGGSGVPVGQLRDLGGPFGVDGTVRIKQDQPGIDINTYITPRADAPPALVDQMQILPRDSQGRREFGTEMTF
jgi:general secretion pathway protein N